MHRLSFCVLLLGSALVLFPGCGGGGGGGAPTAADRVTGTFPANAYGTETVLLRILGSGFGPPGSRVTVRLTAVTGTPFQNGSSATHEFEADVDTPFQARGQLFPTNVTNTSEMRVEVVLSGGSVVPSDGPVLTIGHQEVTSFGPVLVDGSKPVPFTLTGEGFHPDLGTAATVFFEAVNGAPFHVADQVTSRYGFPATIDSDTQISGMTAYAGVLGNTPARVRIRLGNGAEIVSAAPLTTVQRGTAGVQGTWTYERVPVTATGLDYANIAEHPIRGCKVQLLGPTGNLITTRTLGADGEYSIDYGVEETVTVRVLAETGAGEPPITVEDNTDSNALWSTQGAPFQITAAFQTRDYVAPTGWVLNAYQLERSSAPFAVLDTIYEAASAFLAERDVDFTPCIANWSPNNRPEDGEIDLGQIGGAHYDGQELYLAGKDGVDTDEFDAPLIVHEWGHYYEDKIARSDSIAGPHFDEDQLEPTVAFSEGLASALSAMVLYPDTVYKDTYGLLQGTTFSFDLEDNATDTNPGWFSETSVQCMLYDLFDDENEDAWDTVSLGLGAIHDLLAGPVAETSYLTTIFTFIDALKDVSDASTRSGVDALCAHHSIAAVINERGTTETNDGAWAENLPVYHELTIGDPGYDTALDTVYGWNQVEANRNFYFTGNSFAVTITVSTPVPLDPNEYWFHDVFVSVLKDGEEIAFTDEFWDGPEVIKLPPTTDGAIYVVRVGANYEEDAVFSATAWVTTP